MTNHRSRKTNRTNRRSKALIRANHDAIFKLIFENKCVLASLLRAYEKHMRLPEGWVDLFDLPSLVRIPPAEKADNLKERRGDMAWFVKLRKRPGVPSGRGVLIALEIQSYNDRDMWLRLIVYTGLTQQQLPKDIYVIGGKRPPELPIIIYIGERPWKHSTHSADAYYSIGKTSVKKARGSLTHFVLDIGALAGQDLPEKELMTCLIRQQNAKTGPEVWKALTEAFLMLSGRNENDRRARIGFHEHAQSIPVIQDEGNFPSYESFEHDVLVEGKDMTTLAEANLRRRNKKLRGEGEVIGRKETEEEAARLFAATTFGDDTAAILAEHFRDANDSDRLAKVVGWVHECKTGDELLARARQEWAPKNGAPKRRGPARAKSSKSKNSSKHS